VNAQVDSITKTTRWFNAIACYAYPDQIDIVKQLPFVDRVEIMRGSSRLASWDEYDDLNQGEKILLHAQTKRMGAAIFAEKGLTGKGKRIAILDAGFPGVNTGAAFKHIVKSQRGFVAIERNQQLRKRIARIRIQTHVSNNILEQLEAMGYTKSRLYPTIDEVATSVQDKVLNAKQA